MLKQRIFSFLAAAAISAALAFAVAQAAPPTFHSGSIREGVVYEATGICPDTVVASSCGVSATMDLYAYWLKYDADYMDSFMQYYMGTALDFDYVMSDGSVLEDYLRTDSLSVLKQQLVVEALAEKYGAGPSADQVREMADEREQYVAYFGSEEAYLAEIAKMGVTEETYDRITASNYCYSNLYALYSTPGSALYADDASLRAFAEEQGYITADHILLSTLDPTTGESLSGGALAAKRELAEQILARLDAGEDFAALADAYSEDPGRASNPDGYTFTMGEMVEQFESAAYALAEGEHSGIVESSYGYHIILRKPLSDSVADTIRETFFSNFLKQLTESAVISTSAVLDRVDIRALYAALSA